MKRIFFIFASFILPLSLTAQLTVYQAADLITDYSSQIRNSVNKTTLSVEGTPYLYENFQTGIIFPKNDERVFKVQLNVNVYSNLFEMQFDNRVYEMPNYGFDSIQIQGRTFITVGTFKNDVVNFYSMEVLSSDTKGNFLVKQHVIHLLEATTAKAYHQATAARYQSYPANYFIYESEGNNLIPLRQVKDLIKDPNYPLELKDFIKANRIKNRKVADLQKLFNYLYLQG